MRVNLEILELFHLAELHLVNDLGVNLGGFQVVMAEDLAYNLDGNAKGDAQGREGMPGAMGGDLLPDPCLLAPFPEEAVVTWLEEILDSNNPCLVGEISS